MLYMPVDLFGSYIEGREYAIDRNWNDMNQSNKVEAGWLDNDSQQLKNWFTADTYGDNLANSNAGARINQNKATGSDLNTQLALTGQPGSVAAAQSLSDYQTALAGATRQNIPALAGNQATARLGQSVDNAARGNALIGTAPQLRTQQLQNDLTTTQNNAAVLQSSADLLPLQNQVGRQNLEAQQTALTSYQNGTLFPQQPAAATGLPAAMQGGAPTAAPTGAPTTAPAMPLQQSMDPVAIYSAASVLAPGQSTTINGVSVSRDDAGLYVMVNGGKQYIQPPQATPRPTNSNFTFGSR